MSYLFFLTSRLTFCCFVLGFSSTGISAYLNDGPEHALECVVIDLGKDDTSSIPAPEFVEEKEEMPIDWSREDDDDDSEHLPSQLSSNADIAVLVLGQTGCGKSTFLNMAANYFLGGEFKKDPAEQRKGDIKYVIPTPYVTKVEKGFSKNTEQNVHNQGQSQTTKTTPYKFRHQGGSLTFIDTPGLGDTNGVDQDDKNMEQIMETASNFKNLAGIVLLVNGADVRHNATQSYVFQRLRGLVPNIALQKMIVVLTNCHPASCNFPLDKLYEMGVSEDHIFFMNNTVIASDPKSWADAKSAEHLYLDWRDSIKTVDQILQLVAQNSLDISAHFKIMHEIRSRVMSSLHQATLDLKNLLATQYAVDMFQKKHKKAKDGEDQFADYAKKAEVETIEFVVDRNQRMSTICKLHSQVCHEGCGLQETFTVGHIVLQGCQAFGGSQQGNRCMECSKGSSDCSYVNHYHSRGSFQKVKKTLQDKLDQYKAEFDDARAQSDDAQKELSQAQIAYDTVQNAISDFTQKVTDDLHELKKVCTGFNFVQELYSTIKLLEQEKKKCKTHDTIKAAEDFIATLNELADSLSKEGFDQGDNLQFLARQPGSKKKPTSAFRLVKKFKERLAF